VAPTTDIADVVSALDAASRQGAIPPRMFGPRVIS
jgi:hypothetical protein